MASAYPIAIEANVNAITGDFIQSRQIRDEELVSRVRSGDSNAFERLLEPHLKAMHSLVRSIVGNEFDAQDAVQDSLICAFTKLHQLRSSRFFRAWLMQIAVNHARMKLRRQRARGWMESLDDLYAEDDRIRTFVQKWIVDRRSSPLSNVEGREIREQLNRALERLPRAHRDVFILREIQELSVAETAAVLNISDCMVKTNLRRARLRLQQILPREFWVRSAQYRRPSLTVKKKRPTSSAGETVVQ